MKKLPIGIQTFREIREDNCYYVDKTPLVARLAESGKSYFLSRPRRFGKSLFLDTLAEAFAANRPLFTGLYLEKNWDWETHYPVIRISFGGAVTKTPAELERLLHRQLRLNRQRLGVECGQEEDPAGCFQDLILLAAEKYGQRAVILVDEYDKPVLDNLTEPEVARQMREKLKDFYSPIKDNDAAVKFAFVTGVSRFSKMNLFSGLNNLSDISLDRRYATICGYTQADVEHYFAERLAGVDLAELRRWYNGYNFLGEPVYNPFDILLFFDKGKQYKSYWFATGTPTFLMELIRTKRYFLPDLNLIEVGEELLETFDVDRISIEALMQQTGYLTIKSVNPSPIPNLLTYTLDFPNFEVRHALLSHLLDYLTEAGPARTTQQMDLYRHLQSGDLTGLEATFRRLFASISYHNYTKNNLDQYEGYYASVIFAYLYSLGLPMVAESSGSQGRADLIVRLPDKSRAYVFEFKVVEETPDDRRAPLAQIKEKDYAGPMRGEYREIHLVGIEFSKAQRNIIRFEHEQAR